MKDRGRGEVRKRDRERGGEREEERERPVSFSDRATTLSQRDLERQNFNRFFFSLSSIFFLNECVKHIRTKRNYQSLQLDQDFVFYS